MVRFQNLSKGSVEYDRPFWVVEQLDDLASTEPAAAWNIIQEIIALNQSDEILAMVGAGPFEDLMVERLKSGRWLSSSPVSMVLRLWWAVARLRPMIMISGWIQVS